MKVLQIIDSAYRCTIEEQDDPAVWITHAMKGAGADLDVLLCGNAVNYAVKGQDASGLRFGEIVQKNPPKLDNDIARLIGKNINVMVYTEDTAARGITEAQTLPGVRRVSRAEAPTIFSRYDQVWHW
ncbi:MAG: hypothetical protein FD165_518 [Gammaproteobacteria bacterium]|nr:MAG: hypothetical protein FD165_518 [Gammaproteobacteria bacterium]TND02220.1 MAG: hypothetical protein FD120_2384 [Gammaproteobacteria bacterium]